MKKAITILLVSIIAIAATFALTSEVSADFGFLPRKTVLFTDNNPAIQAKKGFSAKLDYSLDLSDNTFVSAEAVGQFSNLGSSKDDVYSTIAGLAKFGGKINLGFADFFASVGAGAAFQSYDTSKTIAPQLSTEAGMKIKFTDNLGIKASYQLDLSMQKSKTNTSSFAVDGNIWVGASYRFGGKNNQEVAAPEVVIEDVISEEVISQEVVNEEI